MTIVTIVELFDEYSVPFSPEVIRSLIMTPTSILNDIILVPKLAVEGNRFWSRSIITTIFLLGMVIKTQYPYPRVKLAYHY